MISLIEKLIRTPGPSGYEKLIREVVQEEVQPHADESHIDSLGNLIVRKGKKAKNGKRVMLAAHIDEIGVMVTHIDKQGFARFTNIGGVFPRYLPSGRVRFLNDQEGVIYVEGKDDPRKITDLDEMFIDTGASSEDDCPVKIGDVAVFERPFTQLGTRLVSKAMDDRISVAVLIETLKQLKKTPHEVSFVFTVQEEVGVRGATTAAYALDPEIGLAIDVTRTGDTPKGNKMDVKLGGGPAIKVRDSGMLVDPRIIEWMENGAKKAKVPYQLEILERGGTDARAIQLTRAGVPAGCLSVPCRYIHSPSEMVDLNDVENSVKLLLALIENPINLP